MWNILMKFVVTTLTTFCGIVVCTDKYYTDKWAVHIVGGEDRAKHIAERHGFTYLGQIMPDFYHFQHRKVSKRSLSANTDYHTRLAQDVEVKWVEQQISKKRVKRDAAVNMFNDPTWPRMWYLHRDGRLDMNVVNVYKRFGITGRGVVVSILDDGIEKDHPDLAKNYDAGASYDVNDRDADPQPRYDYTNENRHGTRCAGEVAAEANNKICSTGVAYEAGIGGVRMLDGDVTDAVEAQSISLNPQHIDIYSASWGPDDDGRTVDGPGPLARAAFFDGITKGRHGLGSIFVWASGNGGRNGDSCNCDGYTNSIYTLSISSASENGLVPWYSEACASTLATTYSSGGMSERQILTTDLRHSCTETHTGTSASAPLAAGICALALQANPQLTWRDMQHIVVLTARQANLNADDWIVNGIGRKVSHHFGFGLMDAEAMVELAYNWTHVPDQHRCQVSSQEPPRNLGTNSAADFTLETDGCMSTNDAIVSLEHVQIAVILRASRRGEVQLMLTSPAGTRSVMLARRAADTSTEGLTNWVLMTTHCWGEQPAGTWTLSVNTVSSTAQLVSWSLIMYGTAVRPQFLMRYLSPSVSPSTLPSSTLSKSEPPQTSASGTTSSPVIKGVIESTTTSLIMTTTHTSVVINITSNLTTINSIVQCQLGTYLLDGHCISRCPLMYYAVNMTRYDADSPSVTTVCTRCNSLTVCTGVGHLLLIAGVVCLVLLAVLLVYAVVHFCWRHDRLSRESVRFRSPHYNISGHVIIGLHNKPLLDSDDDSDSSDIDITETVVNKH